MTAAFPDIQSIPFEGPDTTSLLAFRLDQRYASWDGELGGKIERGEMNVAACRQHVELTGEPTIASGRQEMLENLINSFLH